MYSLQILACIVLTLVVLSTTIPLPPPPVEGYSLQDEVYGDPDSIARRSSDKESSVTQTEALAAHYVHSRATGQFLAITRSGRVQAMAQLGRRVAQFYTTYTLINNREHISLRSAKYSEWYLTMQSNGKFRGGIPDSGNELFEVVPLSGGDVALKAPSTNMSEPEMTASGSGDDIGGDNKTGEAMEDCYLGFSVDSRPTCYSTVNGVEVRFLFVDVIVD